MGCISSIHIPTPLKKKKTKQGSMHGIFTRHMGMNIGFLVLGLFQYFTTHEVRWIQMNSTGWGPQDSVQLPYFSGFMVDITIVFMGVIMDCKPTNISGGPHPVWVSSTISWWISWMNPGDDWGFSESWRDFPPVIIRFRLGLSLTKTIQRAWGTPILGNRHIVIDQQFANLENGHRISWSTH